MSVTNISRMSPWIHMRQREQWKRRSVAPKDMVLFVKMICLVSPSMLMLRAVRLRGQMHKMLLIVSKKSYSYSLYTLSLSRKSG